MKKLAIILTLVLFCSQLMIAQTDAPTIEETILDTVPTPPDVPEVPEVPDAPETSEEEDDGFTITIKNGDRDSNSYSRVHTRWLMLDYGMGTYLHDGKMDLPTDLQAMDQQLGGSNHWHLHLMKQRIGLDKKNRINIMYGLGLEFNKYKFTNNYNILANTEPVTFQQDTVVSQFKKNNLNSTYMTVPLMVQWRHPTKNGNSVKVSAGAYGSILLAAKLKQKSDEFGKEKIKDDFNLNRLRYGLTARVGYGYLNFYVNYGLNEFFNPDKQGAYALKPLSFGIAVLPF